VKLHRLGLAEVVAVSGRTGMASQDDVKVVVRYDGVQQLAEEAVPRHLVQLGNALGLRLALGQYVDPPQLVPGLALLVRQGAGTVGLLGWFAVFGIDPLPHPIDQGPGFVDEVLLILPIGLPRPLGEGCRRHIPVGGLGKVHGRPGTLATARPGRIGKVPRPPFLPDRRHLGHKSFLLGIQLGLRSVVQVAGVRAAMLVVDVVAHEIQDVLHRDGLDGVRIGTDGDVDVADAGDDPLLGTRRMAQVVDAAQGGVVRVVPISGAFVNVVAATAAAAGVEQRA